MQRQGQRGEKSDRNDRKEMAKRGEQWRRTETDDNGEGDKKGMRGEGMYIGRVHACAYPCVPGVHRETAGLGETRVSVSSLGIISANFKYLLCRHHYHSLHESVFTYRAERKRETRLVPG